RALWQEAPAWEPRGGVGGRWPGPGAGGGALGPLTVRPTPLGDELAMIGLPFAARLAGDYLLPELAFSLAEDCRWHRAWTQALLALAAGDARETREAVAGWTAAWMPAVREAAAGLAGLRGGGAPGAPGAAEARAPAGREPRG